MIISASYKTDIPAFYGEWFMRRLAAGYCLMRNPLSRRVIRVGLLPDQVHGIVFWTKNFRPFLKHLPKLLETHIPFSVQYTINGYPRSLENHVVDWQKSVATVRRLSSEVGQRCVVWRYDTVILSDETPREFHMQNFNAIATALEGSTDEVVISFLQLYRKTERNLAAMSSKYGNQWWDPPVEEKRDLAADLHNLAVTKGIKLTICSQPELLTVQEGSKCIDAKRLSDIGKRTIAAKTQGNRPGCACAASRDIGDYDTCPHGCVYCYAVRTQDLAVRRFKQHDPSSEFLFTDIDDEGILPTLSQAQLRLFD